MILTSSIWVKILLRKSAISNGVFSFSFSIEISLFSYSFVLYNFFDLLWDDVGGYIYLFHKNLLRWIKLLFLSSYRAIEIHETMLSSYINWKVSFSDILFSSLLKMNSFFSSQERNLISLWFLTTDYFF